MHGVRHSSRSTPTIDVAVLTRPGDSIRSDVLAALYGQKNVATRIHHVIGAPLANDRSRRQTISRARNEAVSRCLGDWLMFVDDDVVLRNDCIARLHHALRSRPDYGAFAADYRNDTATRRQARHVAMGATLFRYAWLPANPFRWEEDKCECLCRCYDMRGRGQKIEYLRGAVAWHVKLENAGEIVRNHG